MPDPVIVTHARGSYPVHVEPGMLERLGAIIGEHLAERRTAMIADATVHQLYQAGHLGRVTWTGETLPVPAGESSKSRDTWARLTDELLKRQFGRDSGLIGLGGGVIGDLTGFVAATYMRGLPYILVPTTLLAMIDASVGGKTGVNTPQGKNLIGAFHPPEAVVADPLVLTTLPEREYRNGLAEAVKHGLIADPGYFAWMEDQVPAILRRDPEAVVRLVRRSVEIKAEVVSDDERESGRRAILNAGHTVAHALEQASNYRLAHGEAVALGLVAECEIAERMAVAPQGLQQRVAALLRRLGLPVRLPQPLNQASVIDRMVIDKKNRGARIHFALVSDIGTMSSGTGWTTPVAAEAIAAALVAVKGG
jgi:3-dehydroquinate synthase